MLKKILLFLILFSFNVYAKQSQTLEMLRQIGEIDLSWKPVIDKPIYIIKKNTSTIVVIKLYDSSRSDADPESVDVQALFIKTNKTYTLAAIVFSPIDVTKYIDLLVE